jgi:hypothetical protein
MHNHRYIMEAIEQVRGWSDQAGNSLQCSYDKAIGDFPCHMFNISSQLVSIPYIDHNNLAHRWCMVTPLDQFDPKKGGHLIL